MLFQSKGVSKKFLLVPLCSTIKNFSDTPLDFGIFLCSASVAEGGQRKQASFTLPRQLQHNTKNRNDYISHYGLVFLTSGEQQKQTYLKIQIEF
jgi:hypothetical protein